MLLKSLIRKASPFRCNGFFRATLASRTGQYPQPQDKNNLVNDVRPKVGENGSLPGTMRCDNAETKIPKSKDQLNNTRDAVHDTGEILKQGVVRTMEVGLNVGEIVADVANGTIHNVKDAMVNGGNQSQQEQKESYSNNSTGNATFSN